MAEAMAMAGNPYTDRGTTYDVMPIPPIEAHCHDVPAGPIRFRLEARALDARIIGDHVAQFNSTLGSNLEDDGGASLHVYGAKDGLEHLRFDCFEKQPHYHYVRHAEQLNQILMIDDIAVDPIAWTLMCVRERLPEMLDYAGVTSLAAAVRADRETVAAGVERVSRMIGQLQPASPTPLAA